MTLTMKWKRRGGKDFTIIGSLELAKAVGSLAHSK